MGFFSWKTQDTDRSICNVHQSFKPVFPVTMLDNKGNRWREPDYDGYGVFDGKDFYELLAEMNGKTTRDEGITLAFSGEPYISPNLVEDKNSDWVYVNEIPEECECQGFFYDRTDDDDIGDCNDDE